MLTLIPSRGLIQATNSTLRSTQLMVMRWPRRLLRLLLHKMMLHAGGRRQLSILAHATRTLLAQTHVRWLVCIRVRIVTTVVLRMHWSGSCRGTIIIIRSTANGLHFHWWSIL